MAKTAVIERPAIDESFPEKPEVVREKIALRRSAKLLHTPVSTVRDWMERIRFEFTENPWQSED